MNDFILKSYVDKLSINHIKEYAKKNNIELPFSKKEFKVYGNPNRKYCSRDCYIQDRFWTDHDVEVTEEEIKLRQEISDKKPAGNIVLKKSLAALL